MPGTGVFSGPGISPTGLFNPNASGAGLQTIRYTYTATNACSNYIEQTVRVNPTPVANAGPDKVVLEGGQVQLTPALNAGFPVTYTWSPPAGLDNASAPDPIASPADDIMYTMKVVSDKGCNSSDQVWVKVLRKPQIPNIFSPNGDGIHDRWVINFLETYPGCTVEVFNRYGQRIYYTVGYTNPWDGAVNGKPVPVGTYYYIVDPKNGRQKQAGYVDIIR
jgi:gliding motility-associated-like protein